MKLSFQLNSFSLIEFVWGLINAWIYFSIFCFALPRKRTKIILFWSQALSIFLLIRQFFKYFNFYLLLFWLILCELHLAWFETFWDQQLLPKVRKVQSNSYEWLNWFFLAEWCYKDWNNSSLTHQCSYQILPGLVIFHWSSVIQR